MKQQLEELPEGRFLCIPCRRKETRAESTKIRHAYEGFRCALEQLSVVEVELTG